MTSCRNLFQSFPLPFATLSSLTRLFPLILSPCHLTCINTFYFFQSFSPFPPPSSPISLFSHGVPPVWCQNRDVSPSHLPWNQRTCSCSTRTFPDRLGAKLSLLVPLPACLPLLSDHSLRPLPSLHAVLSLSSPLPPVIHLSLIFTDQYAGQQAVWQIVRCAPREEPLSITRVRYWIQCVGFSRVKWKDQAVHSVRWGVSERRAPRSAFPFLWQHTNKNCCSGSFHYLR